MAFGHSLTWNKYEKKLKNIGYDVSKVIAETINQVASYAHFNSQKNIRSSFTIRNKYTENSLKFWKANPKKDISKINAVSGSLSSYLPLQDTGGTRRPKRGRKLPLPTLKARGGKFSGVVRKKYKTGQLSPTLFIGKPGNGKKIGIYERFGKKRKIRMIRNLSYTTAVVKKTGWHTNAMQSGKNGKEMEKEFIRQAKNILDKL